MNKRFFGVSIYSAKSILVNAAILDVFHIEFNDVPGTISQRVRAPLSCSQHIAPGPTLHIHGHSTEARDVGPLLAFFAIGDPRGTDARDVTTSKAPAPHAHGRGTTAQSLPPQHRPDPHPHTSLEPAAYARTTILRTRLPRTPPAPVTNGPPLYRPAARTSHAAHGPVPRETRSGREPAPRVPA